MKRQRGVTLLGLILTGFVLVVATMLVVKVLPEYIEYYKILKNVKAVAHDPSIGGGSASDVRAAYGKHAEIDMTTAVSPADLEITREGGGWHISFSYSRTVPLVANASLLLQFDGDSVGQ